MAQHCDTPYPQTLAQERGVYGIGYNSDMSKMCIRDREKYRRNYYGTIFLEILLEKMQRKEDVPVSYTHLCLRGRTGV